MFHNESSNLFDYCRWNDNSGVKRELEKYRDLDLTVDDGVYFRLAIKHNNITMLNDLIEYYKDTKLQGDHESQECKSAKYSLSTIFEEAEDRLEIPTEIQKIISPYMPHTDEGLVLRKAKEDLSEAGFTLPHFHHLDIEGFNDATEEDTNAVLADLESLQSRLKYRYSGAEYEQHSALVTKIIQEIKATLDPCADLDDFEVVYDPIAAEDFSQRSDGEAEDFGQDHSSSPRTPIEFPEDSANPDSCDYSDILRQENSPMLEAVRQNLDAHGFRLSDEIATLEEAIVALEKISSGLGYVYSGRDYETNKEFIERQITDIKLSASAAADVGRFSRLVGSAEDLPQDVTIAHSVETSEVLSPHYDSPINDQAPGSELIGEA